MATMETNDLPDLDMLLNAAENGSGLASSSGEGSYADKGGFDPDEFAGVVQWYNEQTQNLQQHYDTHLEYQKQKLAEENEAGLLEALQQSLDNFESNHLSDFACLSSSLDNPFPAAILNTVHSPIFSQRLSESNSVDTPSMLKKLLLSPTNENYPKEIDSVSTIDSLFGESFSDLSSPSQGSTSSRDDDTKLRVTKKKKPFTELLKHMEAAENDSQSVINVEDPISAQTKQNNSTRLLNTKRYLRKYGSAPNSREGTPPKKLKTKPKRSRVILHPSVSTIISSSASASNTMNSSPNAKTYTLSLQPNSVPTCVRSPVKSATDNVPVLPVKNYWASIKPTPIDSNVNTGALRGSKRQATKLDDAVVCAKKVCVALSKSVLETIHSGDHDYCEDQNNKVPHTSPEDSSIEKDEEEGNFTHPKDPPQSKQALQKVLKWQDYLQQVRAGTRSAPNSPTCSPKVVRGSARLPNNFMVVSLPRSSKQSKVFLTTSADKRKQITQKVDKTVPLPKSLRKNVVKQPIHGLQEFDKYISVLKNNISSSNTSTSTTVVTSTVANVTPIPVTLVSANKALNCTTTTVINTTGQQKSNEKLRSKSVTQKPTTKSQILQVGNNVRILQTSINSDKTINVTSKPVVSSSGQMLVIQVPSTTSRTQPVPVACKIVNKNVRMTTVSSSPVQKSPKDKVVCAPLELVQTNGVLGGSTPPRDPRDKHSTCNPIKDLKLPAMMANCRPKEKLPVSENGAASPTFKLVTSHKDGVETKSLILSGVTGQLKDVLTLLAKQQAKKQAENGTASPQTDLENKQQQQVTLQKLLSVINTLKQTDANKQSPASVNATPASFQKPEQEKPAMPSPLTLIHEIKQTFSKKKQLETQHKQQEHSDQASKPSRLRELLKRSDPLPSSTCTKTADPIVNKSCASANESQAKNIVPIREICRESTNAKSSKEMQAKEKKDNQMSELKSILLAPENPKPVSPCKSPGTVNLPSSAATAKASVYSKEAVLPIEEDMTITFPKNGYFMQTFREVTTENKKKLENLPVSDDVVERNETTLKSFEIGKSNLQIEIEKSQSEPTIVVKDLNIANMAEYDIDIAKTDLEGFSSKATEASERIICEAATPLSPISSKTTEDSERIISEVATPLSPISFKTIEDSERIISEEATLLSPISPKTTEDSERIISEAATPLSPSAIPVLITNDRGRVPYAILQNTVSECSNIPTVQLEKSTLKFSMARSMAAAEMLASDVIDDGTQEILFYDKSKEKMTPIVVVDDNNNNKNNISSLIINDPDPAVITLEEAMASLEDDNLLGEDDTSNTTLSTADRLFCKLPSYFLTGKVITEDKHEDEVDGLRKRGMKNVLCDPLITAEGSENDNMEWEFNKLPHYFSSGKTRPNGVTNCVGRSRAPRKSRKSSDLAVKLTSVDESRQITPQGAAVNASEIYYSRLPTYYSYGRPHIDVKTFNEEVADAKDDTVTSEILTNDKNQRGRSHSKKKRRSKKKKKRKKHKHKLESKEMETSEKVLYSKIPSYYHTGRVMASQVANVTHRLSPCRFSVHSSSPDSLYYSSRSSRSRSHSRTRRSRSQRKNSLPYDRSFSRSSRSSSRSSIDSDDDSRRSWRRERRMRRDRRERSRERKSFESSDEDDDYKSRRETEAWKERRQYQDEKEKKQEKAMEERRVVYVGRIHEETTKQELRKRFVRFGNIETISLHFRDGSDNYGFITFQYSSDAFRAIEEGNSASGPGEPRYDICFGGRRQFCKMEYEDLDSKEPDAEPKTEELDDFDALLRQARRGLHR